MIGAYPEDGDLRYLRRLHAQRASLGEPSLRTMAALSVALCEAQPARVHRIRSPFAALVEDHPELTIFYERLPQADLAFDRKAG